MELELVEDAGGDRPGRHELVDYLPVDALAVVIGGEVPLVQAVPAVAEGVVESLIRTSDESVERHGHVENGCGHGVSFPGQRFETTVASSSSSSATRSPRRLQLTWGGPSSTVHTPPTRRSAPPRRGPPSRAPPSAGATRLRALPRRRRRPRPRGTPRGIRRSGRRPGYRPHRATSPCATRPGSRGRRARARHPS